MQVKSIAECSPICFQSNVQVWILSTHNFQISTLKVELEAAKERLEANKQSSKSKNSELQSSNQGKLLGYMIICVSVLLVFISVLASGDFCHLLITIASSLDPDQDRQNVGLDLDPNCLTYWSCSWKNFLYKFFDKSADNKKTWKIPSMQRV